MKKNIWIFIILFLVSSILFTGCARLLYEASQDDDNPMPMGPSEPSEPKTLVVNINYNGSGMVNDTYKIYCMVADNPDFNDNGNAQYRETASSGDSFTFDDIYSPCYVRVLYDADGSGSEPTVGDRVKIFDNMPFGNSGNSIDINDGETRDISVDLNDDYIMGGAMRITIGYAGITNVGPMSPLLLKVYSDNNLSNFLTEVSSAVPFTTTFIITGLNNFENVYFELFVDSDNNGTLDIGEYYIYNSYQNEGNFPDLGMSIWISPNQTADVGEVILNDNYSYSGGG